MKDLKYGPLKLMEDFVNLRFEVLMLVWSLAFLMGLTFG